MNERHDLEEQWRGWSASEPSLDELQLKRNLLDRLPERRSRRSARLVLVAAAVSLVTLLIGYESSRHPATPPSVEAPEVVYETGPKVILVLREGAEPIYVLIEPPGADGKGE